MLSEEIFDKPENLLPVEQVIIGSDISAELSKAKDVDKAQFLLRAQKHYIAACKHIIQKSGLKNEFLKNCRCLHPSMRKSVLSSADIAQIAKKLPLDVKVDLLIDEWNLLRNEWDEPESDMGRIDTYWHQFYKKKTLQGETMFPSICNVTKAALTVSHGNSDVERGFSISSRVLTDARASMCERTLNAILTVKDALKLYGKKPHLVPIDKELLSLAYRAHQSYRLHLEDEKKRKEEEEKRKQKQAEKIAEEEKGRKEMDGMKSKIEQKEKELKARRKEENEKRRTADKLFTEANARLKKAIEAKDMQQDGLAQAMLEGVSTMRKEQATQKRTADQIQDSLDKKRESLITSFFAKKPRNEQ